MEPTKSPLIDTFRALAKLNFTHLRMQINDILNRPLPPVALFLTKSRFLFRKGTELGGAVKVAQSLPLNMGLVPVGLLILFACGKLSSCPLLS